MSRNKRSIKSSLLNFIRENPGKPYNYKQIAARLEIDGKEERDILLSCLEELLSEGSIEELQRGKYIPKLSSQFVDGKVDMTKAGAAYILVEGFEEDIFVQPSKTRNALHGDKVKVLLYAKKEGKKQGGEVVEILERKKLTYTGVLELTKNYGFLIADEKRMNTDIFIPGNKLKGAKNGEKVLVQIVEWPLEAKNPVGEVIEVLGQPGEHFAEMNAIIAEFSLPTKFPDNVIDESEALPFEISDKEIGNRRDMRTEVTFTIDPEDAKDFDDALSVKTLENGLTEVGIHIADVTHYVKEGTQLDNEALQRATSVYLVDRVIPMLPERLSNFLCSLRPHEDKLTFSVVVTLDEDANIIDEWFGRTIIHSDRRFSYEEAQEILENQEGEFAAELLTLNKLAYKLRDKKFAEGAIAFETEEVKFKLDETGKPIEVYKKVRKDAHKLIEDFMLLANKKVAEYMFKKTKDVKDKPFVYRVHETPSEEKLSNFARIASMFGYKITIHNPSGISKSMNRIMSDVEGKPEKNMLTSLAIRSMPKAFYTSLKTSHYGLGFEYYTHFTSPIRRYPDVIAHRLLAKYLSGSYSVKQEVIEDQAKHCSAMEIRASDAERASIKFKQVEYMSDFVGSVFSGVISGVTEWGIYVEMDENKCEGMARISELMGDYYLHDEDTFSIRGMNTGKVYRLGDRVRVKVKDANLMQRTIDLIILNDDESELAHENKKSTETIGSLGFSNIDKLPIFDENSPHAKPQIPASSRRNISKNTKPKTNSKPNGRRKK